MSPKMNNSSNPGPITRRSDGWPPTFCSSGGVLLAHVKSSG